MSQQFPIEVKIQLIDTLCSVFYYKKTLAGFLNSMNIPAPILETSKTLIFDQTKRVGLENLIGSLLSLPESEGLGPVRRMMKSLSTWSSFQNCENPEEAREAVQKLAELIKKHDDNQKSFEQESEQRRLAQQERLKAIANSQRSNQLDILKESYINLFKSDNPQRRGRDFEDILQKLFNLEDLKSEAPFALQGEQIDGAFEFSGNHYLIEAKWTQDRVSPDQVSWFGTKLNRRLMGTRGLMISINGFTDEAIRTAQDSKCVILMDGDDLYQILDPLVDLNLHELLHHKLTAFALRSIAFLSARTILSAKGNT